MPDERSPARLLALARANPTNRLLLERLPALGLADAWLVAGCLCQAVWNARDGRPAAHGVKDYDVFYHDASDLSWDAEDRVIRRVAEALGPDAAGVEVRNQARVHLWYAERFGGSYPRLGCSRDGIARFPVAGTCVGIALDRPGGGAVAAPNDLEDLFRGVLRPNPLLPRPDLFAAKVAAYQARWPWLTVAGG